MGATPYQHPHGLMSLESIVKSAHQTNGSVVLCMRPAKPSEVLGNRQVRMRFVAALSLCALGPAAKPAVPTLQAALTDPEPMVREAAALALGRIGPGAKAAVPALTKAAADEEAWVKKTAGEALKIIDPKAASAAGVK